MKATNTPAQRKPRARKPVPEHLQITTGAPAPRTGDPHFWLHHYLHDLKKQIALSTHLQKEYLRAPRMDEITHLALISAHLALISAQRALTTDAHESLRQAQQAGLLLYCWPGTRFYHSPPARH